MKILNLLLLFFSLITTSLNAYNIGLCIMATGKYIMFVKPLIDSAEKHFLKNHNVTYFVFTDGEPPKYDNIVKIFQKRLGWPYDTMMRFESYYNAREIFISKKIDYLYALDADMLFVDTVGDEIIGDRVATQHPGFVGKRGSYETNSISTAYIADNEGEQYFAGGFYGGSIKEFLKELKTNIDNIYKDLKKNYIAVWHDESHHNRYLIDNKPTVILNPSYCYPEKWTLPYPKKLLALDKNHAQMRED